MADKKYKIEYGIVHCEDNSICRLNSIESVYIATKNREIPAMVVGKNETPSVVIRSFSGATYVVQIAADEKEAKEILDDFRKYFLTPKI